MSLVHLNCSISNGSYVDLIMQPLCYVSAPVLHLMTNIYVALFFMGLFVICSLVDSLYFLYEEWYHRFHRGIKPKRDSYDHMILTILIIGALCYYR